MRLAGILILLFFTGRLSAQRLNGVVLDKTTKAPVADATVFNKLFAVYTTETGHFSLGNARTGDTVTITHIGYKTYKFAIAGGSRPFTTLIYLQQDTAWLNAVTIRGQRNFKKDSLGNRREFASTFNYKVPGIKSIFITRSPYTNNGPNNTSELVSINVLQVVSWLTKYQSPQAKLQKVLLRDEQDNYVYRLFSREKVVELTHLTGDSLLDFMDKYCPSVYQAERMGEYDMVMYIKKSYDDFIKPKHPK